MGLLTGIYLKNFKSFREKTQQNETTICLRQSSYLVGVNNAGKTNIFHALRAFFENQYFVDGSFLNKTDFLAKKAGYNRSEITIVFDLLDLSVKKRKADLIKRYTAKLSLTKVITFSPDLETVTSSWRINNQKINILPESILWLINTVRITYIHPQEGRQLLVEVQKRLRERLLENWGRGANLITHQMAELEAKWTDMKKEANRYLSQSLTDSLQGFWPECGVAISLPKNIKEIISISDISFQGYRNAPEIELTAQGTGAQSTVLYLAAYLLDSDRTLNRGEYHRLWLMEEPESFMHADLLIKFAKQINSQKWLNNIQMVISTHSPVLLASSRAAGDSVVWNILKDSKVTPVIPADATESSISGIGDLMGDPNFFSYFLISKSGSLIFCEDKREVTIDALIEAGVNITSGVGGIGGIQRLLSIFEVNPEFLKSVVYFIFDGDKGSQGIKQYLDRAECVEEVAGFKKYIINNLPKHLYLISLPDGEAVEDLFDEYTAHLTNCISQIWNPDFTLRSNPPAFLSQCVNKARGVRIEDECSAAALIRNIQDTKDSFWKEKISKGYKMNQAKADALTKLLGQTQL